MNLREYMLTTSQIDVILALNNRLATLGCRDDNEEPVCAAALLNEYAVPFTECEHDCLTCLCEALNKECALGK